MLRQRTVISLQEARKIIAELPARKPKPIRKPLLSCLGNVLAEDVCAPLPFPFFSRSGYDGFGITAETDQDFPKVVEVVSEIGAGAIYEGRLKKGQAVRIMTGAQVPEGVIKIIPFEKTRQLTQTTIELLETERKSNITPAGDEFEVGELLLKAGTTLTAGCLSLLAAFGFDTALVEGKLKVGLLTTGSELLEVGSVLENGKIYNSNRTLLEGLVKEAGAELIFSKSAPDDSLRLKETLTEMASFCDFILTCGGVSVGDYDFMAEIAEESDLLFNKCAMRPGSPTSAFVFEQTPVIALSGNPSACFVGFYFFADPLIQRCHGLPERMVQKRLPFLGVIDRVNNFDRYLRGTIEAGAAKPLPNNQSSAIGALAYADCLIRIPAGMTCKTGMEVDVWCLPYK